jgi:hypothetical protein
MSEWRLMTRLTVEGLTGTTSTGCSARAYNGSGRLCEGSGLSGLLGVGGLEGLLHKNCLVLRVEAARAAVVHHLAVSTQRRNSTLHLAAIDARGLRSNTRRADAAHKAKARVFTFAEPSSRLLRVRGHAVATLCFLCRLLK